MTKNKARAHLRAARKAMGLTQTSLATSVGITQEWYSRIERGISDPSLDLAHALARRLERSIEHLFFELSPNESFGGERAEVA